MDKKKELYRAREDSRWAHPVVDEESIRQRILPDGTLLPYRYYHIRFAGERLKMSLCLPVEGADFHRRFFQYLSPFPGPDEELGSLGTQRQGADDRIAFAILNSSGFVESNMGAQSMFGPNSEPTDLYKCSAAAAEYAREKICALYGEGKVYAYLHGGSGGGYKTMSCAENTDSFDGAVPYVIGCPVSIPNSIVAKSNAVRRLRRVLPMIADAVDAGKENPFDSLTGDELAALREISRFGLPLRSWHLYRELDDGSLPVLLPPARAAVPEYFTDFWSKPGYEGTDPQDSAVRDRTKQNTKVVRVVTQATAETDAAQPDGRNGVDSAWKKMLSNRGDCIEVESVPSHGAYLGGVEIKVLSGAAKGAVLKLDRIEDSFLVLGAAFGFSDLHEVLAKLRPGDDLLLDNSDYIAFQNIYRHQLPDDPDYRAFDQFRPGGENADANRRLLPLLGPGSAYNGCGSHQDGRIQCKMIVVAALMDEAAYPWMADWYRKKVERAGKGGDFRLWYMDRCLHGDEAALQSNYITNYLGALYQALLDVSAWAEDGVQPPRSTVYAMDGGSVLPEKEAPRRLGIQPVIRIHKDGKDLTDGELPVKAGAVLVLDGVIETPPGAGTVTGAVLSWDDDAEDGGKHSSPGHHLEHAILHWDGAKASFRAAHVYSEVGTHFITVRARAQRSGHSSSIHTQIRSLERLRVVVLP